MCTSTHIRTLASITMKIFLTIFLTFLILNTFGQSCDTLDGKAINCIDSLKLKQGYWIHRKNKLISSSYNGLGSESGCQYNAKYEPIAIIQGEYKDNKKIGKWEYFYGHHSLSLDRIVTYLENGDLKIENYDYAIAKDGNLVNHYYLKINNDSTIIKGKFYHELDSLTISLENDICEIKLSNKNNLLSFNNFNLDKLEYEILRLQLSVYDRDIKIKKTR